MTKHAQHKKTSGHMMKRMPRMADGGSVNRNPESLYGQRRSLIAGINPQMQRLVGGKPREMAKGGSVKRAQRK